MRMMRMPVGLGSVMSPSDIYQLALSVGFPSDTAVKMTAIALKESGGNPTAYNGTPPDDSYGLYQINMYGSLGPARMSQFGLTSKQQLFDPTINTEAAYSIWGGNDNNLNIAWSINGADASRYQQFLPVAEAAAQIPGVAAPTLAFNPSLTDTSTTDTSASTDTGVTGDLASILGLGSNTSGINWTLIAAITGAALLVSLALNRD